MGIRESKAADNRTPSFPSDRGYLIRSEGSKNVESSGNILVSTWHCPIICIEAIDERERGLKLHEVLEVPVVVKHSPPNLASTAKCLAELLCNTIIEQEGELKAKNLAEAFLEAPDLPPVTNQSLEELDGQNIVTNIKLRHDINFVRDLSFRPNLDGVRGCGKESLADKYWTALVAEIRLYDHLFQGKPLPQSLLKNLKDTTHYAQRRLPTMFRTIRDILKSLIPDRDHPQVDQILDVSMLMQGIEHAAFDLVRFGEWIAHLLKEHCAPMRDVMVDAMVFSIKKGIRKQIGDRAELIVHGLRELLAILEAMKLDVANHQIRSLKTLLIEDTVNFERQYHLDGLVSYPPKVDIKAARSWYAEAIDELSLQHLLRHHKRDAPSFELEVFTRAVVALLLGRDSRSFPETFYLDYDRLRGLKAEIDNLVFLQICTDMFLLFAKHFSSSNSIPLAIAPLQASITAIMNESKDCSLQDWMENSDALSLEILRQASHVTGQPPTYYINHQTDISRQLQHFFSHRSTHHATRIEELLLPQILRNVERHATSPTMDLFINLVSMPRHVLQPVLNPPHFPACNSTNHSKSYIEPARLMSLANRIAHIILLHWRTWYSIAYIQDKNIPRPSPHFAEDGDTTTSIPHQPRHASHSPRHPSEEAPQVMTAMKTGELSDTGKETHIAHQTQSQ